MEDCRITFYTIDRCGYYQRGQDLAEFGKLSTILDDLMAWVSEGSMKLGQTCTYEPDGPKVAYRTFCFDLVKDVDNHSYLLTTWNELPSSKGRVAAVKSLDPVGAAEVNLTAVPDNSIPGYATYFWFLPHKEIFATIQFQHNFNGRENLEAYIRGFLTKFAGHVVTKSDMIGGSISVLGYRKSVVDPICTNLYPQFNSFLYRKTGQINFIRNNWSRIRKIIKKDTLKFSVEQSKSLWQSLLQTVGVRSVCLPAEDSERFQFALNHVPSEQEVNEMISFWETQEFDSRWDDLGFKLEGESEIRWLSYSLAKSSFSFDVERENDEVVNARSLLEKLIENQQIILSLISQPHSISEPDLTLESEMPSSLVSENDSAPEG